MDPVDPEATAVMARVARTFNLATSLLPAAVRRDVRRLYLVMRTLDDAVDRGAPDATEQITRVEAWATGAAPDGREAALLDDLATRHPGLPREAVLDFCAGMRADLAGSRPRDDAALDRYCYQVAGTVGRLMTAVLGSRAGCEEQADAAARALGRAMQRTNILRDVTEDARAGRVYLPDQALIAAGLDPATAAARLADLPSLEPATRRRLLAPQVARADADYEAGIAGIALLRNGQRSILVAARLYREILREVERDGYGGSGRRAVVGRPRKAWVLLGSIIAGARPAPTP
ncbi:MAG: phytoene/squalene synthase family protein [Chloroflexi bacterium]|nr:phytoene/squalene synthase family protein [Chloroflexota bacterium]